MDQSNSPHGGQSTRLYISKKIGTVRVSLPPVSDSVSSRGRCIKAEFWLVLRLISKSKTSSFPSLPITIQLTIHQPRMPQSTSSGITVHPLPVRADARYNIGIQLCGADLECLSPSDEDVIKHALYEHQIIIFKNQSTLTPAAQYAVTRLFDPAATSYGHGKNLDAKRSILHPDLKTIPHQPQVQVIGNGLLSDYEGLKNVILNHPHHKTFHAVPIPEENDRDSTHFYRWHIDAALYHLEPPMVTSLLAVKIPKAGCQTLRYDDGTGDELSVPRGSTVFVSGETMYDILSESDQKFARETKVVYAPHPYIWMSAARSRSTGLGIVSEGLELSHEQLPPIEQDKIKILPMCWKNPVTGKLALQIHPSAVQKLIMKDGTVMDDLKEVRDIVYRLQRPGIKPELVYAIDWEEGDFVIFNNRAVLHSVTGSFLPHEIRIFRQCNMAASKPVQGPQEMHK